MMDNKCNSEINFPKFSENVVRLFDVLVITVNKQDLCGCVHSVVFTVSCPHTDDRRAAVKKRNFLLGAGASRLARRLIVFLTPCCCINSCQVMSTLKYCSAIHTSCRAPANHRVWAGTVTSSHVA